MIKAEDTWRHSKLNEHHYACMCGKRVYFDDSDLTGSKRVYFDDSDLTGKKTIITCPNCGVKTEYTYVKRKVIGNKND